MKTMSKTRLSLKAAQSFFTTWALMKASRMEPGNILTLAYFLFSFFFYCHVDDHIQKSALLKSRKTTTTAVVLSVIYTVFYMAVDYPRYIEALTSPLFRTGIICFTFLGFLFLFYHILLFLFSYTGDRVCLRSVLFTEPYDPDRPIPTVKCRFSWLSKILTFLRSFYIKHTALCAFFLCFIFWFPYFLYQYPGVMTPDSINQFEQVLGVIPYSNHHPWMHTLLIKLLYTIGYKLTGSMLIALSCYTFFQMCVLALSVSYFVSTIKKYCLRSRICLFATLFYALVPYHAVFSVTMWKDVLFAAAILSFGCSSLCLIKKANILHLCIFALSGLAMCLLRSNGWYAFILCFPFLLLYFRKKARVMFPVILGIFLCAVFIKYPVMNAFHVTQPDLIESLAIPTQQITAVICNDRALTDEERDFIENVVDLTYIKKLYDPSYADNIKELVRAGDQNYLAEHKWEFFRLWAKLGLKYPSDYMTAYIHQTYGYWYPDSFYPVADVEGVSATSLGVSHTPLIGGPLVIKSKEIAIKLGGMLPLYGPLWSMGVICWALIFCIGNAFVRSETQKLILYLPSVAILLTVLIATPVAAEFRYVYFMVFSLPFYIITSMLMLHHNTEEK